MPPSNASSRSDDTPPWMRSLNDSSLYHARPASPRSERTPERSRTARSDGASPAASGGEAAPADAARTLRDTLQAVLDAPGPAARPDIGRQPAMVGPVSSDVAQHMRQVLLVLESRYAAGLSSSLLVEFALRAMLAQVWERGAKSEVVQWLDATLPRRS